MIDQSKHAKHIYELFCKLNARNMIKKRGTVMCCDSESSDQEETVKSFYDAILQADETDVLEGLILDALRELTMRQSQMLCEQLKTYCFQQQQQLVCDDDQVAVA